VRREFTAAHGSLFGWSTSVGAPVLVLHGGPGLGYEYVDGLVEELVGSFEVATFQQRGLLPSTEEGPFDVATAVRDVVEVLDALDWERAWVVGHSWGGHLLLHLALRHPERCAGGLAVDPLGGVGDGGRAEANRRFAEWRGSQQPRAVDLAGGASPDGLAGIWPAYFASMETAPPMPHIRSSPAAFAGLFASLEAGQADLEANLPRISVPMGFLAGAKSPLPPDVASRATAGRIPGAWCEVLDEVGHFPWLEAPGSVLGSLRHLVGDPPAPPGRA
jgi:pimeloyl-ACP methyl ester carboxylesterase